MKCDVCPFLVSTSYEYGEYECSAGIPEEKLVDFKDGLCGCRHSYKTLKARADKLEEQWASQWEGYGEWYDKQREKELNK